MSMALFSERMVGHPPLNQPDVGGTPSQERRVKGMEVIIDELSSKESTLGLTLYHFHTTSTVSGVLPG